LVKEIEYSVSIGKPYRFVKLINTIESIGLGYLKTVHETSMTECCVISMTIYLDGGDAGIFKTGRPRPDAFPLTAGLTAGY
jgi:hypothetical protein